MDLRCNCARWTTPRRIDRLAFAQAGTEFQIRRALSQIRYGRVANDPRVGAGGIKIPLTRQENAIRSA